MYAECTGEFSGTLRGFGFSGAESAFFTTSVGVDVLLFVGEGSGLFTIVREDPTLLELACEEFDLMFACEGSDLFTTVRGDPVLLAPVCEEFDLMFVCGVSDVMFACDVVFFISALARLFMTESGSGVLLLRRRRSAASILFTDGG